MSTIKAKNIKQTVVGTTIQPIKIGGILDDGSDAKISIGSDGTTTVVGNATTSTSIKTIADYSVIGSAVSVIDLTNLNLEKGNQYRLFIDYKTNGTYSGVYMFVNGNNTVSNYYVQTLRSDGSATTSGRANGPEITYAAAEQGIAIVDMFVGSNNRVHAFSQYDIDIPSNNQYFLRKWVTNFTATNVTSIRLNTYQSTNFGVGTRIKLVQIL